MTRSLTFARPSRPALRLEGLEYRAVPAAAQFLAGTLTVTAAEGETITVAPVAGQPAGHLTVSDGHVTPIFTAGAGAPEVRNLVIRFDQATHGTLTVSSGVGIAGRLAVVGAGGQTAVTLAGDVSVGTDFTFRGSGGTAADTVTAGPNLHVGGAASLRLGGGANAVTLGGGAVARGLTVIGGAGSDTITVSNAGMGTGGSPTLTVGGGAAFRLGAGANDLTADGSVALSVGGGLTYGGGAGPDVVSVHDGSTDARLAVGRGLVIGLGAGDNRTEFDDLTVGGGLIVGAAAGADSVRVFGTGAVGRGVVLRLGDGANVVDIGTSLHPFAVGRTFAYAGGAGDDAVALSDMTVGRNLVVALGAAAGTGQQLSVGNGTPALDAQGHFVRPPVVVNGDALITGGAGADTVSLDFLTTQGRLSVNTRAGDDRVTLGQAAITRATTVRLGGGNDQLVVDPRMSAQNGAYLSQTGLPPGFVTALLDELLAAGVTPTVLGGLVTDLSALGLSPAALTGLAADVAALGVPATGLDTLLGDLKATGLLDLVGRLAGLGLAPAAVTTLLDDVLANDPVKLTLDLSADLPGLSAGAITTLAGVFNGPDVHALLSDAAGLQVGNGAVAGLLDRLAGLGLTGPGLTQLLGALDAVPLGAAGVGGLLADLAALDPAAVDLTGVDLGQVLTVLDANRSAASRLNALTVFGQDGDDRVTLGGTARSVQFAGRVWLVGGRGIDTLVTGGTNTYQGANNGEDFENGSL